MVHYHLHTQVIVFKKTWFVLAKLGFNSAWNHAEDVVAVSPLTINVCITRHETFSIKY